MKAKEYRHKIRDLILEENLLLPDFQRDFVWKPQDQQSKLACSLFLDIPIGSILVLDKLDNIGLRELCYKEQRNGLNPERSKLLMDGQQRISTIKSIFNNLYINNNWKETNNSLHNNLRYRWFLNLSLAENNNDLQQKLNLLYDFYWTGKFEDYDIEDIESVIINKKVLKTNEGDRWHPSQEMEKIKNYCTEENLLPLFLILSDLSNLTPIIEKISEQYIDFLIKNKNNSTVQKHINNIKKDHGVIIENKEKKSETINKIKTNILQFFNNHIIYKEIYGVEYEKSQLNKAIVAFNTMNTGGISLGVFDIVSAKYSKLQMGRLSKALLDYAESFIRNLEGESEEDESVAELIEEKFVKDSKNLITKNFSDMYLNMLALFIKESDGNEFKVDCIKQKSLLKIEATQIEDSSEKAVESLILAFQFLIKKCGVPSIKDIKYKLTVLPIAYNLYKNKEKIEAKEKIEYSYWMSLFSGKYEKGQNAFSIEHLNHLIKFIKKSQDNQFKKYEDDLCNKRGYSDLEGFKAFYEDNGYSYNNNIGEYFLQFILSYSYKKAIDIFKHGEEKTIKIKHFKDLHKDHIIPDSWINPDKKNSPVHSILNKFYSPSERNQKRLTNSIDEEIEKSGMEVLCIDTQLNYRKEEFNTEDKIIKSQFLESRFKLFEEKIKSYLKKLNEKW